MAHNTSAASDEWWAHANTSPGSSSPISLHAVSASTADSSRAVRTGSVDWSVFDVHQHLGEIENGARLASDSETAPPWMVHSHIFA